MMKNTSFQNKSWSDLTVLITGVCGTIGSELAHVLVHEYGAGCVIGLDNNETELFFTEQRFQTHKNTRFFLADIRDQQELNSLFKGVDIVFHAAAYKHVVLCERSPHEAIQTNIQGTQNVIRAAVHANVGHVIYTSSDKAVNPTNVMGTSKLMGERLMTAANAMSSPDGPVFSSVRFGNVLGSRGSVVPIFHEQIKNGHAVTLTDPDMTRFIMSIRDAANLVINSLFHCRGGEILITKMPVVRIEDLANVMIDALAPAYNRDAASIDIQTIGRKPGEKMFEELMTSEEVRRTAELEKYFAVVPPDRENDETFRKSYPDFITSAIDHAYVSTIDNVMSKETLKILLNENGLLSAGNMAKSHPDQRYWP